jgi:GH25 family lysozyme M1 (1,4-beta-N-acetylmuramidase)
MTRENLKNQVNSKIVNDELSEEEMMHDIMQMVDAHVTQQLILSGVSHQREQLSPFCDNKEQMGCDCVNKCGNYPEDI